MQNLDNTSHRDKRLRQFVENTIKQFSDPIFIKREELKKKRKVKAQKVAKGYGL